MTYETVEKILKRIGSKKVIEYYITEWLENSEEEFKFISSEYKEEKVVCEIKNIGREKVINIYSYEDFFTKVLLNEHNDFVRYFMNNCDDENEIYDYLDIF